MLGSQVLQKLVARNTENAIDQQTLTATINEERHALRVVVAKGPEGPTILRSDGRRVLDLDCGIPFWASILNYRFQIYTKLPDLIIAALLFRPIRG